MGIHVAGQEEKREEVRKARRLKKTKRIEDVRGRSKGHGSSG